MAEFLMKYGVFGIMLGGLIEGILLPFPMEVVSIPIYLANMNHALWLAVVLIICSVTGSIISYWIAYFFGDVLNKKFGESSGFLKVQGWYKKNTMITLLTSAITPIPYELYVFSAGICHVNFKKFILGSLCSRIIRHLPQGILVYLGRDLVDGNIIKRVITAVVLLFIIGYGLKKLKILINAQ